MTELTERYLRNYLEKKSLVHAASLEVNETANRGGPLSDQEYLLRVKRHQAALIMLQKLWREEEYARRYYLDHLRSEE